MPRTLLRPDAAVDGAHAAPLVSATLPRSRLLVLWRDGRDVLWTHRTSMVRRALAAHAPDRALAVRYEELLADAPSELRRIVDWLGLGWGRQALDEVAEAHAFARRGQRA